MKDEEWPERLGNSISPFATGTGTSRSRIASPNNLEALIDRGSSSNVTISRRRTSGSYWQHLDVPRRNLKENPGILSQHHGKKEQKAIGRVAAQFACYQSRVCPPSRATKGHDMRAAISWSSPSSRVSSCCMKNKLLFRILSKKTQKKQYTMKSYGVRPPRGSGHVESRSSRRLCYSCRFTHAL
jgi:hypothetical protein